MGEQSRGWEAQGLWGDPVGWVLLPRSVGCGPVAAREEVVGRLEVSERWSKAGGGGEQCLDILLCGTGGFPQGRQGFGGR